MEFKNFLIYLVDKYCNNYNKNDIQNEIMQYLNENTVDYTNENTKQMVYNKILETFKDCIHSKQKF